MSLEGIQCCFLPRAKADETFHVGPSILACQHLGRLRQTGTYCSSVSEMLSPWQINDAAFSHIGTISSHALLLRRVESVQCSELLTLVDFVASHETHGVLVELITTVHDPQPLKTSHS